MKKKRRKHCSATEAAHKSATSKNNGLRVKRTEVRGSEDKEDEEGGRGREDRGFSLHF